MLRLLVLAAAFSGAISSNAVAQHGGTEQEQKVCTRDVQRFCRAFIDQGDMAILPCLQQNRQKLTAACAKVLTGHGQ